MNDTVPSPRYPRRSALRLLGGAIVVAAAATGGLAVPSRAQARDGHGPDAGTRQGARARVEGLLARLTLDEKVSLLHGATDPSPPGYVPGVARPAGPRPGRLPAAHPAGGGATAGHRARRAADPVLLGPEGPRLGPRHRPARDLWIGALSRDLRLRTSAHVGG